MKAAMAGVPLQQSATAPAGALNPSKNLSSSSSSSSPCSLSLHVFYRRPLGRGRASWGGFAPVARFGRGGGGYRPSPGRGGLKRSPGNRSSPADPDDEALDFSRLTSNSVRLIDDQQNMIGVVPLEEAIQRAEDAALDLVILSADADPPVLRIVDYNKYRYEQQKKKKDQQKKSAASRMDMKEIKMGYNIDSHDYGVRLRAAQRFLNDGDKVKVIVNLKRRENDFRDMAIELLKRFQEDVGELGTEESHNFSDRNVFLVLVPNKLVAKKSQPEPGKKKEAAPTAEVPANP
ncbi:translation initiation factor IF3-2, chloroplastic-like [Wolffia australiana]